MTATLAILHEDSHCLAVAKAAGVLTQGPAGDDSTLEASVRRHLSPDDPGAVYLGTVHRLDRPVSGVVVWAKTPKAARRLAEQFARRGARKEYWAVVGVSGSAPGAEETWDDWLADDVGPGRVVRPATPGAPGSHRAITRVQPGFGARLPEGTAWLRLWPETGRTHQLRAQSALRGMPIVGDIAYGSDRPFPAGIALHARALTVRHPVTHRALTWIAPLPTAWADQGFALPDADDG